MSFFRFGGSWNSSGPRRGPSAPALSKKSAAGDSTSFSRFLCVMSWGAFSTNVKASGTCSAQSRSTDSLGMR